MHSYNESPCSACGDLDGCHVPGKVKRSRETATHGRDFPRVVCLCGSTRFGEAFRDANLRETLAGHIVLSIGCDTKDDASLFGRLPSHQQASLKAMLDELHLRKIDLADEVLILNVNGYIGESTRRELEYATKTGKTVRYLTPPTC